MSAIHRRLGQDALLFPTITSTDHRGQKSQVADMEHPVKIRGLFHSSTGGVVLMNLDDPLPERFDRHSQVGWKDGLFNVGVPAFHNGPSRHVRYWAVELVLVGPLPVD